MNMFDFTPDEMDVIIRALAHYYRELNTSPLQRDYCEGIAKLMDRLDPPFVPDR